MLSGISQVPLQSEAADVLPAFISRLVAPGMSAFQQNLAKDFFKNHSSELKLQVEETLNKKREFSKGELVAGEYEMKIECLHGKFEFTYEVVDRAGELFEKRRTNYSKRKTPSDKFLINVRDEHAPATLKINIKDQAGFLSKSSRFHFTFHVVNVRHHLVKPGMWQIAEDVLLGEGGCASVYLGMNNLTGTLMAVKVANLGATGDPYLRKQKLQQLEEEIETMKILNHENIVRYLGMEKKDHSIYIFMDFISGGSIKWVLSQFTFSESLIQQHTKQVLKGLEYLHDREIVHRDIKASNILYDESGRIYLTDFGETKKYTTDLLETQGLHGTPQFMAPESFKTRTYSTKSDIWSFACTILQMLTGSDPWADEMKRFEEDGNVLGFINTMARKIDDPKCQICDIASLNVSSELKHLLNWCFQKKPEKRPSVKQLLRHPWFDTVVPATPSPMKSRSEVPFSEEEEVEKTVEVEEKEKKEEEKEKKEEEKKKGGGGGEEKIRSENWKEISKKGVKERILQMKTRVVVVGSKKDDQEEEEAEGED